MLNRHCPFRLLLYIFPVFEPLAVGRQLGPHLVGGLAKLGLLVRTQLASLLDGLHHVIDLVDTDQPGDRRGDLRVANDEIPWWHVPREVRPVGPSLASLPTCIARTLAKARDLGLNVGYFKNRLSHPRHDFTPPQGVTCRQRPHLRSCFRD